MHPQNQPLPLQPLPPPQPHPRPHPHPRPRPRPRPHPPSQALKSVLGTTGQHLEVLRFINTLSLPEVDPHPHPPSSCALDSAAHSLSLSAFLGQNKQTASQRRFYALVACRKRISSKGSLATALRHVRLVRDSPGWLGMTHSAPFFRLWEKGWFWVSKESGGGMLGFGVCFSGRSYEELKGKWSIKRMNMS